jgi:hypothetical protein
MPGQGNDIERATTSARRLQMVLGGVLAAGIVVAVVIGILAVGGDRDPAPAAGQTPAAPIPAQRVSDLKTAVAESGCELTHPPSEGRGHEARDFTPADYRSNPPSSGTHFPVAAQDGIYAPGSEPPLGMLVHSLEHGRINLQYAPGTPARLVSQLETLVSENGGYHMLLYRNVTGMQAKVAATAWGHVLTCQKTGPRMWDALRAFRDGYVDKAPERVP